jgi:hypothetical protein
MMALLCGLSINYRKKNVISTIRDEPLRKSAMQARMKTSLSIKIENKNLNIFKKTLNTEKPTAGKPPETASRRRRECQIA